MELKNCPYCLSDNIDIVSGVSYGVKCMDCYKIKIQCCDSKKEAIEIWNNLTCLIKEEDEQYHE